MLFLGFFEGFYMYYFILYIQYLQALWREKWDETGTKQLGRLGRNTEAPSVGPRLGHY